jgi:hypothetical protein
MRKQTIDSGSEAVSGSGDVWLDLERLAQLASRREVVGVWVNIQLSHTASVETCSL